jgi:hypothetical protein
MVKDTAKNPEEIVYSGTFDHVNDVFYQKGWTDGLSIIPPTREAVEQMLSWTDLSPDEEIGVLPLANRRATPWHIAVNAVMAGCRPEYMPVLIAAVAAMADADFRLKDLGSTGCIKPFMVVNGPIIKQLDFNYGTALLSLGRRANATIGRGLGLVVRNIAGFKEGITSMGTFGWPGGAWIMAEDEEASPWDPFHVDRGFDRTISTVTAGMMMNATHQFMTAGATAQLHLTGMCHYMGRAFGVTSILFGMSKTISVFISPPNAAAIAGDGYSKADIQAYMVKHTTLPVDEVNTEFAYTEERVVPWTVHNLVQEGRAPKAFDVAPGERMPIIESPELIDIFVCGSRERNRNLIFRNSYARSITREIQLPANWETRLAELRR